MAKYIEKDHHLHMAQKWIWRDNNATQYLCLCSGMGSERMAGQRNGAKEKAEGKQALCTPHAPSLV